MSKWSEEELRLYNIQQIEEIQKYKWLESEKAGYDIGELHASVGWISKYSKSFRQEWEDKG